MDAVAVKLSPHVVGKAFADSYYQLLRVSPELVHKFYKDDSQMGRPGDDGNMSITTTKQGINEKIMSLKHDELTTDIKSVYSQSSFNGGLLVLVTGQMTGKNSKTWSFTQNFFLAPQDTGFYVLNDILSYTEHESELDKVDAIPVDLCQEVEKVRVESDTEDEDYPNMLEHCESDEYVVVEAESPKN